MILANECCAMRAKSINHPIPYRGSRPLSSVHESSKQYKPPQASIVQINNNAIAKAIFQDIESLGGVTRAIYDYRPIYHNGLCTDKYCHSTSPLRRYPDILVHHQLKANLAQEYNLKSSASNNSIVLPVKYINAKEMDRLCIHSSKITVDRKIMQQNSVRYWSLKWLVDVVISEAKAITHELFTALKKDFYYNRLQRFEK